MRTTVLQYRHDFSLTLSPRSSGPPRGASSIDPRGCTQLHDRLDRRLLGGQEQAAAARRRDLRGPRPVPERDEGRRRLRALARNAARALRRHRYVCTYLGRSEGRELGVLGSEGGSWVRGWVGGCHGDSVSLGCSSGSMAVRALRAHRFAGRSPLPSPSIPSVSLRLAGRSLPCTQLPPAGRCAGLDLCRVTSLIGVLSHVIATGGAPSRFPLGILSVSSLCLRPRTGVPAGSSTCAGFPGLGYPGGFEANARQMEAWGIDAFKVDGCNANVSDMKRTYPALGAALNKTGRYATV